MAAAGTVAWGAYRFSQDPTLDGILDSVDPQLLDRLGWIALLVCLVFLAPFVYAALEVGRGVIDSTARETVDGVVLRRRARSPGLQPPKVIRYFTDPARRGRKDREPRYYVAVDDGTAPRVEAWRVRRDIYQKVRQHQKVHVEVRPRLGHVRSVAGEGLVVETVAAGPVDPEASADLLAAAAALARD
jgi:hypothetical protein